MRARSSPGANGRTMSSSTSMIASRSTIWSGSMVSTTGTSATPSTRRRRATASSESRTIATSGARAARSSHAPGATRSGRKPSSATARAVSLAGSSAPAMIHASLMSEDLEQPPALQLRDRGAVLLELGGLVAQEGVAQPVAEDVADELGVREGGDRLAQVLRQRRRGGARLVLGRQLVVALDAAQARAEGEGEGEVGVAARIGRAQLDA